MPWVNETNKSPSGLKGRENQRWTKKSSRGLTGRNDGVPLFPGHRPPASALG